MFYTCNSKQSFLFYHREQYSFALSNGACRDVKVGKSIHALFESANVEIFGNNNTSNADCLFYFPTACGNMQGSLD